MSDTLILYQSHTGFTARYAQWLAEALSAPALPLKDCPRSFSPAPKQFLCGGSVHGSGINGLRQFESLRRAYPQSSFFYFATGLRPSGEATLQLLRTYNFKKANPPPLFYFRGGIDQARLEQSKRLLLLGLRSMLKRRPHLTAEEELLLRDLSFPVDYSSPEQLAPLLAALCPTREEI